MNGEELEKIYRAEMCSNGGDVAAGNRQQGAVQMAADLGSLASPKSPKEKENLCKRESYKKEALGGYMEAGGGGNGGCNWWLEVAARAAHSCFFKAKRK